MIIPQRVGSWRWVTIGILAFVALYVLFFHRLADRDLWSSHEARAGMNGQSLLAIYQSGVWPTDNPGLPQLHDGRIELQKPPLYYWFVATLGGFFGEVNEWAVRLPATLSALGCVLLLALWGYRQGEPAAGLLAGVVLATSIHFTWLARIGRIDMPLSLTVALAILAFASQPTAPRVWKQLVGYLALAAGAWLKGPIGILLPGAVLFVFFLLEGVLPRPWHFRAWAGFLHRVGAWWGVPLVIAMTVPWFLWADFYTHGEWTRVFLWHHNFQRGLGGSRLRSHPWWLYVPLFSGDFLPWTPALFWAMYRTCRTGLRNLDRPAKLGLVWFTTMLISLSLSNYKRPDYLLPAYSGAALFVGWTLWRWLQGRIELGPRSLHIRWQCLTSVVALVVLAWWLRVEWYLPAQEPGRDYRKLAQIIRTQAPAPKSIHFFRAEAHALAFRIGRPLTVLIEWEDLCERVRRPGAQYVVCAPRWREELERRLPECEAIEVTSTMALAQGWHERPLLFLRIEKPQPVQ